MTQEIILDSTGIAFKEDALSEADAAAASKEIGNDDIHEEPCFMNDDGPSQDIPTHIMLKTSRQAFGVRDGESVEEAIARQSYGKN